MSEKNKKIVEEINRAFLDGKPEDFLKHCADDVSWIMEGEKSTSGKAAIREWMSQAGEHSPPKFSVDKMLADGDSVVCYGTMTMDGEAEWAGRYSYCDVYTFSGDKVVELRSFAVKHKPEGDKSDTAAS